MAQEPIDSWIQKTATMEKYGLSGDAAINAIRVIHRQHRSQGNIIVDLAEKIRPILLKMFTGVRDENGMLVQPARVRAISLNLAQRIVRDYQT